LENENLESQDNSVLIDVKYFFLAVVSTLGTIAAFNFTIDPAGIYREPGWNTQAYAYLLSKAEHGLWAPPGKLNERLLAKAKIEYSQNAECFVIGSSHVMQLSSARAQKSLPDICRSLVNIGVSGAGIEDHFALAYLVVQQRSRPKIIVLGIDPWTFSYEKDVRWTVYRNDYFEARGQILGERIEAKYDILGGMNIAKLSNLINLQYAVRSVRTAISDYRNWPPTVTSSQMPNISIGGEFPAYLRDGSYVYSAKYIAEAKLASIPVGGGAYKTTGVLNTQDAINAYRALLRWLREQSVEPILLMTPYHDNVWKVPLSADAAAMRATERIVLSLANEINLRVAGSFDPGEVGCSSNEFYDYMHPRPECLGKLRTRLVPAGDSRTTPR
jgi:hypothetical protein